MISLMTPQQTDAQSHAESAASVAAAPVFEVASVKPSSPQRRSIHMRHDPGIVDIGNLTLCDILAEAYNVDNLLISGPSWLDIALAHPDRQSVIVVVGGQGYVIDPSTRSLTFTFGADITEVIYHDEDQVVFSTFTDFRAFGPGDQQWRTWRLS